MKAFTDLLQSKKLAEFLPLESADMHYATWAILDGEFIVSTNQGSTIEDLQEDYGNQIIPCWSLAALLDVLPKYELNNFGNTIKLDVNLESLATEGDETLLDLVVNMIIHLHELKIL